MEHPADPAALRDVLSRGLVALGRSPAPVELDRFERLATLLDHWGQRINLTGHRGVQSIAERLLLEAVALGGVLPQAEQIVDLGSGAGIPGIPIAICRPEVEVLLVESRERRHHFQRAAIRELQLENVRAIRGRAEELEPTQCGGVISQAAAQAHQALGWMCRWLADSGWLALACTRPQTPWPDSDLTRGEWIDYAAPGGPQRSVWLARLAQPRGKTSKDAK